MPIITKDDVINFMKDNIRKYNNRKGETNLLLRLEAHIIIIRTYTEQYILGERDMCARLQDIKDVEVNQAIKTNKNPFNLDLDGGANAKIQQDSKRLCKRIMLFDGEEVKIIGKELNPNAVVLLDILLAGKLIAKEKDTKKKTLMQERLNRIIKLPTREGYGVKSP